MLKLTFAVLAIAVGGIASAAGWRDLRIDASSEAGFDQSVEVLRDKLTKSRRHAFERALEDLWTQRTQDALAAQREYTEGDYYAELDGLSYEQVVRLLDPTGEQAKRYRAEYYHSRAGEAGGRAGYQANGLPVYQGNAAPLDPPGYQITSYHSQ
jgi:hypothetical protein